MAAKRKAAKPAEEHVGTVEHYYPKVKAAAVKLDADLKVGDTIHIQGHSDDFTEKVESIQLDHQPVSEGHAGQSVGVGVPVKVHEHSEVTRVVPDAPRAKKAAKKAPKKAARKAAKKAARKAAKKPARKAARKAATKGPKRRKAAKARKAKPARRGKAGKRKAARKAGRRKR